MFIWFCILVFFGIINFFYDWILLCVLFLYYVINIFFSSENKVGLFIFGSVFLLLIGVEVFYLDFGYVGKNNIYGLWFFVKICLLLNYFG